MPPCRPRPSGAADDERRDLLRRRERPADQHRQGDPGRRRPANEERPELDGRHHGYSDNRRQRAVESRHLPPGAPMRPRNTSSPATASTPAGSRPSAREPPSRPTTTRRAEGSAKNRRALIVVTLVSGIVSREAPETARKPPPPEGAFLTPSPWSVAAPDERPRSLRRPHDRRLWRPRVALLYYGRLLFITVIVRALPRLRDAPVRLAPRARRRAARACDSPAASSCWSARWCCSSSTSRRSSTSSTSSSLATRPGSAS